MEQTETLSPPSVIGRRQFIYRCISLILIIMPFAYFGMLLSVAVHEVVGHGLTALCLGGKFLGFSMTLRGMGYAFTLLPQDAPAWKQQLSLAGGVLSTFLFGTILLFVGLKFRGVLSSMITMVLSTCLLLECFEYLFWNSVFPSQAGDPARILTISHSALLRPAFIVVGAAGKLATTVIVASTIFRRLESWLGNDGRLSGIRRVLVFGFMGLLPAPFFFMEEWGPLLPGSGLLPAFVGAGGFLAVAIALYCIPSKPAPAQVRFRNEAVLLVSGWLLAILSFVFVSLWLHDERTLVRGFQGPYKFVSMVSVSPDRLKAAFCVSRGVLGGDLPENHTSLHVWNAVGESTREFTLPAFPWSVSWSADSSSVVYCCLLDDGGLKVRLMQTTITDGSTKAITDTMAMAHRHSPDGKWIGFQAIREQEARLNKTDLKVLELSSGRILTVAEAVDGGSFLWVPESNAVIFHRGESLLRKSISEGAEEIIYTVPADSSDRIGEFLLSPDGGSMAFREGGHLRVLDMQSLTARDALPENPSVGGFDWSSDGICYIENPEDYLDAESTLKVYFPSEGKSRAVVTGNLWSPLWMSDNHILVRRSKKDLWIYDAGSGQGRQIFSLDEKAPEMPASSPASQPE